jgi:trehalose 6-phosphate synthase/phosphatase
MLVTPLRDGMNLVAKEYVASRSDGDGVLVLSEFAGAAGELADALVVNPYDVAGIAEGLERALEMSEAERRQRMQSLRDKVASRPVELWASSFLSTLELEPGATGPKDLRRRPDRVLALADELARKEAVVFLLDYDGTLVPIQATPENARPDDALTQLLSELAGCARTRVAVVSGRTKESLTRFVGALPLALVAEHGVWARPFGGDWACRALDKETPWRSRVSEILADYCARTPGAFVEEKTAGVAWHYRNAERQLGAARARELRLNLLQILAQQPVAVVGGRKVVEVRLQEIDKGVGVKDVLLAAPPGEVVVAFGDDRTDEDMFRALDGDAYTFAVSSLPSQARFRIGGPGAVRDFLARFIESRRAQATAGVPAEELSP